MILLHDSQIANFNTVEKITRETTLRQLRHTSDNHAKQ